MRYLIWDFDGTLAEREGRWSGAVSAVLRRHRPSLACDPQDVRPYLRSGYPWHEPHIERPPSDAEGWWRRLEPVFARFFSEHAGFTAERAQGAAKEVRDEYLRPGAWALFPDVPAALARLGAAGWRHVILSNHVPELEALVQGLGIRDRFVRVLSSACTGFEKPHPRSFALARLACIGHADLVMIGDSVSADVRGAESCGIPAILVRTAADERWRCADLADLPGVIEQRLAAWRAEGKQSAS